MSWIKQANKIGKYERTYRGFRIYCTKESEVKQHIEQREDGQYRITEFIKGWFVATDKIGARFERDNIESLAYDIDIENAQRFFDKRGW